MGKPEIRYAKSGDVHIAYQTVGDGPIDLVLVLGWVTHLDAMWDYPPLADLLRRLASFSRLIIFDKRGVGLSDRAIPVASLEQRMDDVRAVMDAAGSKRAALMGVSEGGPMCLLFAATYPERTTALIINGGYAMRLKSPETPSGLTPEEFAQQVQHWVASWGTPVGIAQLAPSMQNDPELRAWWSRYLQLAASPGAVLAMGEFYPQIDVRDILGTIQVPTLVLHARGDRRVPFEYGEAVARGVPGAKLVALDSADHMPWIGDVERLVEEVQEFLTGVRPRPPVQRVLATVLCTDIVGSTARAAVLGDAGWRSLIDKHDAIAKSAIDAARGRLIKTMGDGLLATFDGPARGIRCAAQLCDDLRGLGLDMRAGLHAGEIELRDDDITGIAVNISARVAALAATNEIFVSRTVKDLVAGSGIRFEDRGVHALKGVPEAWRLYAVASV